MAEGEIATTVVSYREGDAPVALPALAVVAVKLLGLSELIQAIPQIVYLPMLIRDALAMGGGIEWVRLTYLLVNFCDLAIGIFLLWKAEWVVKRVVVPANETPPMTFDEHFQGVAFSIVGVLLIVCGVGGVWPLTFSRSP